MGDACKVCETSEKKIAAKYKCPTCFLKYCSLTCWNQHKECGCTKVVDDSVTLEIDTQACLRSVLFPTDDTVSPDALEQLKESEELRRLLTNPHLREILSRLDSASKVKEDIQAAMMEPIFVEFADVCLRIVEPQEEA